MHYTLLEKEINAKTQKRKGEKNRVLSFFQSRQLCNGLRI